MKYYFHVDYPYLCDIFEEIDDRKSRRMSWNDLKDTILRIRKNLLN